MAFMTGNALGSSDVRDLKDNAVNLDWFANGPAASYPDRFGAARKSVAQMNAEYVAAQVARANEFIATQNAKQAAFDAAQISRANQYAADKASRDNEFAGDQVQRDIEFNDFLESSGFETPVDYAAGLGITRPTQILRFSGELYRAKDASLPFTTTTWASDAPKMFATGDAVLRQDVANASDPNKGAAQVGRSVVHVDSIQALMLQPRQSTRLYQTMGYRPGSMALANPDNAGGNKFIWSTGVAKSSHNGSTAIDPDRASTYPTDWSVDAQKAAWYAPSGAGTGCFIAIDCSTVHLEQCGASQQYDSTRAIQAALNTGKTVTYSTDISFAGTVTMDTWGQVFEAPRKAGQYLGPSLEYTGVSGTYAIHVRAPGCVIKNHDFRRTGPSGANLVLAFRDQEMIPGNADIDLCFEDNNSINFAIGIRCVGRNVEIKGNLFSGYSNSAILLEQFRYTSGTPEYYQTLERGYRGFDILGNRFHASTSNSITNNSVGHENLYGCLINDNIHDTDGKFFAGSLRQSTVDANQLHRHSALPAVAGCFYLETCRDVIFSGNMIGGESDPVASATMPSFAFRFATKNVSNVQISGGAWNNISGTPVVHIEPPDGIVTITGVGCRNVAYSVANGTSAVPPFVDVRNDSGDGRGVIGYNISGCSLDLAAPASSGTYLAVLRFIVRGAANSNVNVKFTANRTLPPHNLSASKQTEDQTRAYAGNGAASQSISFGYAVAWATIGVLTPAAANAGKTLQLVPGTGAANTLAQLTETGVDVKGEYNTSGVIYSIVAR